MKKVLLSAVILATMISVKAQSGGADKTVKINGGIEVGLPIGDFGDIATVGFGASLMGEYSASEKVGITLSAGFLTFSGKTVNLGGGVGSFKYGSTSIIPVLAGVKYHFNEKVYGQLQAGLSFFNNGGGSAFTYAPTIGVMASEKIDLSLKYQAATKSGGSLSFIGVRAAYTF
jgi:hypothetical protein